MAFENRVFPSEMNARNTGATKLPNQPKLSATDLKKAFDAPSKDVLVPKHNGLIDELESSSAASKIGAYDLSGVSGATIQSVLVDTSAEVSSVRIDIRNIKSDISGINIRLEDVGDMKHEDYDPSYSGVVNSAMTIEGLESSVYDLDMAVADSHTHANKDLLDVLSDNGVDWLHYDGTPVGDMTKFRYDDNDDGVVNEADTARTLYDSGTQLYATIDELNFTQGVTFSIQDQLDNKIGRGDAATGDQIQINDPVWFDDTATIIGDLTVLGDTSVEDITVRGDITDPWGHKINAVVDENGDGLCPQLPDSSSAYGLFLDAYGQWSLPPGVSPDYVYYHNLASAFSRNQNYKEGDYVAHYNSTNEEWEFYEFWTDHPAGAWTGNDVTQIYHVLPEFNRKLADTVAPEFVNGNYSAGDYVMYHGSLCRFFTDHTGAWNGTDVDYVVLSDGLDKWVASTIVTNGTFTFSGLDDTKGWAYKPFAYVADNSVNMNPSCEISSITGSGTTNMSITYTTDADGGTIIKLRAIK